MPNFDNLIKQVAETINSNKVDTVMFTSLDMQNAYRQTPGYSKAL